MELGGRLVATEAGIISREIFVDDKIFAQAQERGR